MSKPNVVILLIAFLLSGCGENVSFRAIPIVTSPSVPTTEPERRIRCSEIAIDIERSSIPIPKTGETVPWLITLKNNGPVSIKKLVASSQSPELASVRGEPPGIPFPCDGIAPGGSCELFFVLTPMRSGNQELSFRIESPSFESNITIQFIGVLVSR